jgi:hypothetical protein
MINRPGNSVQSDEERSASGDETPGDDILLFPTTDIVSQYRRLQ